MNKVICIIYPFSLLFYSCSDQTPQNKIISSEVKWIFISKADSAWYMPLQLPKAEADSFLLMWNSSKAKGPSVFLPEYTFDVVTKDSTRRFRCNGVNVKETTDYTYSISDTSFFHKAWLSSKPVCPDGDRDSVIPISYGMPTRGAFHLEKEGKLYLGGCMADSLSPHWYCKLHKIRF